MSLSTVAYGKTAVVHCRWLWISASNSCFFLPTVIAFGFSERLEPFREAELSEYVGTETSCVFLAGEFQHGCSLVYWRGRLQLACSDDN